MAKLIGKLSARTVETMSKSKAGRHADGANLYLNVSTTGAKSWLFMWKRDGQRREMGLGSVSSVSLADARKKAADCRRLLAEGHDPLDHRKSQEEARRLSTATAKTFEHCASAYIDSHQHGWRNPKHRQQWRSTLAVYAYPVFGAVPVDEIGTDLVLKVLDPIWREKPETASRLRGRIEAVLDWAKARGYRQGENPARWRGHMDHLLPRPSKIARVRHHPALPVVDVPSFIPELRQRQGIAALALEFTILTAARSGEVREAIWAEIDLGARVWIVPAGRTKAGRTHRVPLSSRAIEILENVRPLANGDNDYLFPGQKNGKPLSDMTLTAVLRRMGRKDVVHGFRSTFRDWAGQGFPREVCEAALAHTVKNKTEAAYARSDLFDRRIALMEAWAEFCDGGAPSV